MEAHSLPTCHAPSPATSYLALAVVFAASLCSAQGAAPAPAQRFPFDRGRAFRVAKTRDGRPALWLKDKLILATDQALSVDYLYHGRMQVGDRVETVHGFVSINPGGRGLAISAKHVELRGKVLSFADLVLYGFNRATGVVATDGSVLAPAEYDDIFILSGGKYILARKGRKQGIFDFKFKPILPLAYDELSYVGGDRFGAVKNGRAGIINAAGKIVVPFEHEEISANYLEGVHLFGSSRGNRAGVIDAGGQVVFQPRFSITKPPDKQRGLIFVTDLQTGKRGVINAQCQFIPDVPLQGFSGRWVADGKRSDIKPIYDLAKTQWDARRRRLPVKIPDAYKFPALEKFRIELHLHDVQRSAIYVARQQAMVKWQRAKGGLELELHGYLGGKARVRLDGENLVYEQIENSAFGGKTIDGKLVPPRPIFFTRMPPPARPPARKAADRPDRP